MGLSTKSEPATDRKEKIKSRRFRSQGDAFIGLIGPFVRPCPVSANRIHIAAVGHKNTELQALTFVVLHGGSPFFQRIGLYQSLHIRKRRGDYVECSLVSSTLNIRQ